MVVTVLLFESRPANISCGSETGFREIIWGLLHPLGCEVVGHNPGLGGIGVVGFQSHRGGGGYEGVMISDDGRPARNLMMAMIRRVDDSILGAIKAMFYSLLDRFVLL